MDPTPDKLIWDEAVDAHNIESKTEINTDPLDGEILLPPSLIVISQQDNEEDDAQVEQGQSDISVSLLF